MKTSIRKLLLGTYRVVNLLVVLTMVVSAPTAAFAYTDTDQEDYAPGSTVTIFGDNSDGMTYLPGETVKVTVTQPVLTDPLTCEGVVDENGAWSCQVILSSGLEAVGGYTYTTFGLTSSTSEIGTFTDAVGDFSINFIASAPLSYNHLVGGGAFDDRTVGKDQDNVESLEAADFACGDIVTFLAQVVVDDTLSAGTDGPQTIVLDFQFLLDTTGTTGVAIGDITYVGVNYPSVVDLIPGEDNIDQGIVDDGGSTATLIDEWYADKQGDREGTADYTGGLFVAGSTLNGRVEITDLERNEKVVVRVDTRLYCKPGSRPTGNLQASIIAGTLTKINGSTPLTPPAKISVGNQTVPFYQFGNLFWPELDIQKTVTTVDGTCPGSESLNISAGDTVKYCYAVSNPSNVNQPPGAALYDVTVVTDDNRTPGDTSDDFTVTLDGLTDVDDDGNMDDLAAGGIAEGEETVIVAAAATGTYTNTAAVTGYFFPTDTTWPLSDSDTAAVVVTFVPAPAISIVKTTNGSDGPTILVGQPVTWTYLVTNTGNVPLTGVSVTDDKGVSITCSAAELAAGASMTCTASGIAVAGDYSNIGTASGTYGSTTVTAEDPSSYFGAAPAIDIQKTPDSQVVIYGETANFTIVVTNTGNVPLTGVTVTDPLAPACDAMIGDLAVGASSTYTCAFTPVTESFTNTANVSGAYGGTTVTDSDTAAVVVDILPDISLTKTANPTSVPETGGEVVFTFEVTNHSSEPFILNSLTDDTFGDLDGEGTCDVPVTIAAGGNYTCAVSKTLASDTLTAHTNWATASGADEQGNPDSATDDATVTFTNVEPTIDVTKTANPTAVPETGADVVFTFVVENTSNESVTITSLVDSVYGPLDGDADCMVGTELAAGDNCSFEITRRVEGDFGGPAHVNVFTGKAVDNEGTEATDTDDATVTFNDVAPLITITKTASPTSVPETGGDVTFTFLVENTGPEDVTLTTLSDTVFGDLAGNGTCDVPQTILIGGEYSCAFEVFLESDSLAAHTNVVTATAVDDDNTPATDTDDETVTFTDVAPAIRMTKTANPTSVPETGGNVTFTFLVENIGPEDVTLTSLEDTVFGDLNTKGTCVVPQTILIGGSYSCTYTVFLASDSLAAHTNVVTATAVDDDNTPATDDDDETVTFTDVAPLIRMTKTANPTHVPETGGDVTFTFLVENIGVEDVTLTSLTDTVFGDLNGQGNCVTGGLIPAGESYSCELTINLSADNLANHYNVVTAVGTDDDGTTDTDTDDETVTFDDVAPDITITKTASPTHVPETGGDVTFTFVVENIGVEEVTLTSLTDTVFGDLNGQGTCVTGGLIAVGGSYTCSITKFLSSDSLTDHYNVVTAVGTDDDGTTDTATNYETVKFDDVAPAIRISKTASPTSVPETGANVTFTFLVENIGPEDVTLTTLSDTVFGDLDGKGTCDVPQTILIGESYSCEYTVFLSSDSLAAHTNVVTATAVDDDNTPATDDDDETVTFTNVPPTVTLDKSVDVEFMDEPGGDFTFTLTITNTSAEEVTITTLTDSQSGDAVDFSLCAALVGTPLAAGASTSCTYVVAHVEAGSYDNTADVLVTDNDGSTATAEDTQLVWVDDAYPTIDIEKSVEPASLPEPGGVFHFTLTITNTSVEPVVITQLTDWNVPAADLSPYLGRWLQPGEVLEISYDITHTDAMSYRNDAAITVQDNEENSATDTDSQTVYVTDVPPTVTLVKNVDISSLPEPGGVFTFTLTVTNTSVEPVEITDFTDPQCPEAAGHVGEWLDPGQILEVSCPVTHTEAGIYENTASVTVMDNELNQASASDDETVTVTDVMPTIEVTKTPSVTEVPETGGDVTFTFVVKNTSSFEAVTITSLSDSVYSTLAGDDDCKVGTVLDAGANCEFTITHWVEGDFSGPDHVNVFTAHAKDNEGNDATDDDNATVDFTNVLPTIDVTKTPSVTAVPETGGDVTFTFVVKNTSTEEPVTITSLVDSVYGPLAGDDDCEVGTVLAAGAECTFSFTEWVEGDYSGDDHYNVFTTKAVDNDNTEATDSDDATVDFTNVLPYIEVTKTANPTAVPETGGDVTFTFVVKNTSSEEPVTITSLADSVYGTLAGDDDCEVGTVLAAGAECTFSITKWVEGDYSGPDHVNVFTGKAVDNDNTEATDTDDATVDFTDVKPTLEVTKTPSVTAVPETGGDVVFTFVVKNTSTEEPVTILSLVDSVYGTLAGDDDCKVGTVLAAGASCEFSVTKWVEGDYSGPDHINMFTAVAEDNDGTDATDDDDATVDFTNVLPTIDVTKTPSVTAVPETGGDVTFTFVVKNTSTEEQVTITSLSDSVYGPLAGSDDCKVGTVLAAGAECTFSFTKWVEGDFSGPDHVNTFTAHAEDNDKTDASDSDDATVDFTDVKPTLEVTKTAVPVSVPETGGNVTFTFVVKNTSTEEPVTITSLVDSVYGPLEGDDDCKVGTVLAAGATCEFSFTKWVEGDFSGADHVNVFAAKAVDNDNTEATDTDDATVDFTNVLPTIDVTKTPSVTEVPETGGDVIFTFLVKNTSTEESVTILSLEDDVYGTLAGDDDCKVGTVLAAGAECTFSFTKWVEGDFSGPDHVNVFTAVAEDNDGTDATDDDNATVDFTDVKPTLEVTKTADPISVPETGANVLFTFVVKNTSSEEPVTITSLSDSVYGTLAGDDDCKVGTVLAAGASCEFSFTEWVEGDFSGPDHVNVFTAVAEDNDGTDASDTDDATVDFTNVLPYIEVTKTADPTAVPETGGDVTFTFVVKNTSTEESVTILSLVDSVYGTLAGDDDCKVGTVLAAGASCEISFTEWVEGDFSGNDHVNVFTAHAVDNDKTDATDDDDATVDFTNVLPTIDVTKTADPTAVLETGGNVTFTFVVKNTSSEEPVTITSLSDSVYGPLTGNDDCKVGTVLAAGASCTFSITRWVEGDYSGPDHVNVFTAHAVDNDKTDATDDDDATVDFTNVLPTIDVTKTANPTAVLETGGTVTFTFVVKNTSTEEPVTITSLTDSVYGPLEGDDDCKVGTVLAAGASCEFSITRWVEGDFSGPAHNNVFSAVAEDNDGTDATDDDDATVTFDDVLPTLDVTKTANPTAVPETGGDVVFTFVVKNTSLEPVSITSLSDSIFGTLAGDAYCKVGTILAAGTECSFSITEWVEGDYETSAWHTNVFTAKVVDNEANEDTDTDDAEVTFTDITAAIEVKKYVAVATSDGWFDADDPTGPYALEGSIVKFKFVVTNSGNAPLSNITLTDSDFDLTGCIIPESLAAGAWFKCVISTTAVLGQHFNTATVSGSFVDGAGNTESDSDTDDANYFGLPKIRINKTIDGFPLTGLEFTFEIRSGAAPVSGAVGTVIETKKANEGNNGQVVFDKLYKPGTYQLCEVIVDGYIPDFVWGTYGVQWFKPGYAANQGGLEEGITVCVNFTVGADGSINFQAGQQTVERGGSMNVDNRMGKMPHTIGFWKNHSSASGSNGGQEPVLDQMLYKLSLAEKPLTIGLLVMEGGSTPDNAGVSATNAVRLLNKSRIDNGKKKASDPCFNLAAQLVAYRLNQPYGAIKNPVAKAAADYAQQMLVALSFNGSAHITPTTKAAQNLNYLAMVLDAYNNNTLTLTALALPYPGVLK